ALYRQRAAVVVQAAAAAAGGVAADRAIDQVECAEVLQAAAVAGRRVGADRAIGQRERAEVLHATAAVGVATGDRQSVEGRADAGIDLEPPALAAAADRHPRRRARDRVPSRIGQLELTAGQGNRLRRGEDGRVEGDGAVHAIQVSEG